MKTMTKMMQTMKKMKMRKMTRRYRMTHCIDGFNVDTSNWARWVNCPRNPKEENVDMLTCKGRAFYITVRDIYPGQELLVYYGHNYAETLGIDVKQFFLGGDS